MKHRLGPVLLVLSLAAVCIAACDRGQSAPDDVSSSQTSSESSSEADLSVEPIEEGEIPELTPPYTLSNFVSIDLDGNTVTHDIFSGSKLTMVYVWAVNSGPCIDDMPTILEVAEDNAKKGVQTIGIIADLSDQKKVSATSKAIQQAGIKFTQLLPTEELCEAKLYDIKRVPVTFFVDREGNQVGEDHMGKITRSSWGKIVDSYLKSENEKK